MTNELFFNITNNAQIGTALLIGAIALWVIDFKLLEDKRGSAKSSK